MLCVWFTVQTRGNVPAFSIRYLTVSLQTSRHRSVPESVVSESYLYPVWGCSNNGCAAGAVLRPGRTQSFIGQGWLQKFFLFFFLTEIIYFSNSLTSMLFPQCLVELVLIRMAKLVLFYIFVLQKVSVICCNMVLKANVVCCCCLVFRINKEEPRTRSI